MNMRTGINTSFRRGK